ncbi:MAG TPA: cytochrome c-type biogenesis protein [Longimicrobiales bacterium]|nr:cytochrome c-type biogenesis protein [Longimicrobiales bacterium]
MSAIGARATVALALACAASACAAAAVRAQERPSADSAIGVGTGADSAIEARTRDIASGLRCVVCQGLSIEDSPAELAREMRAIVREQVAAGRSREEIEAFFVARYGEFVLLEPRAEGFNLVVYALPIVALLVGAGVLVLFVRRWSAPEEIAPAPEDGHAEGGAG